MNYIQEHSGLLWQDTVEDSVGSSEITIFGVFGFSENFW